MILHGKRDISTEQTMSLRPDKSGEIAKNAAKPSLLLNATYLWKEEPCNVPLIVRSIHAIGCWKFSEKQHSVLTYNCLRAEQSSLAACRRKAVLLCKEIASWSDQLQYGTLKVSCFPDLPLPFLPVHKALKFSTVFGTVAPYSPKTTRPAYLSGCG